MDRNVIAHGFLILTEQAPNGNLPLHIRMPDGELYEVEAKYYPNTKNGEVDLKSNILEVKVKRIK